MTVAGPVETQCFDVSSFCSQSISTSQWPRQWSLCAAWRSTEHSLFALELGFLALQKCLGRTEMRTRESKE